MRFLLLATAVCVAAVSFTGCSFTISGPCNSFTHQSRLAGDCGCGGLDSCGTCGPNRLLGSMRGQQAECGSTNFGDGAPCGMESLGLPVMPRLRNAFSRGADCGCGDAGCGGCGETTMIGDCGCDGGCDGGCGDAMYDSGVAQAGLFSDGIRVPGSRIHSALANRSHALGSRVGAHMGCGRFGCGREGKLCLGCKARGAGLLGRLHPKAGEIPHTTENPGMMGPQAPQYVYPYYTTRGPRDFLMANPPSIGY